MATQHTSALLGTRRARRSSVASSRRVGPASARAVSRALDLPRADNRQSELLDAAARLFRERGYTGTTMRDIAAAAGMLAGSIYYHFPNKDSLLIAVYTEGVRRITAAVALAVHRAEGAWPRLEAACVAHLDHLLARSDYASVVIRVHPQEFPPRTAQKLRALRDGYEDWFRRLCADLPLPREVDANELRLMLLGALNSAVAWYRAGRRSPAALARRFIWLLRAPLEPR